MLTAKMAKVVMKNSSKLPIMTRAGLRKLLFNKTRYNRSVNVLALDRPKEAF